MSTPQKTIYLLPGELTVVRNHETVWTLLGSCVSIIFHHARTHQSVMCHAQLPEPRGSFSCRDSCPHPCDREEKDEFKFVTCSFKYMWAHFEQQCIPGWQLEVGLYGGASIFGNEALSLRVGEKNLDTAKHLLQRHYLQVHSEHIGGTQPRKLLHDSYTGKTTLTVS